MRYFTFFLFLLFACDTATKPPFDKNAMIANLTEQVILVNYQSFCASTAQFSSITSDFTKNPTPDSFLKLNLEWKHTMFQWKKCELFNFGVAKDKNYMFDINFNEVRPKLIENVLKDTTNIDKKYVKSLGSAAKGLPAIAFLLTEDFTTLTKSKRKIAYLDRLAKNLNTDANLLFEEWKNSEAQAFIQNKDNASMNILANQLLALIENLAMKRAEVVVKQYSDSSNVEALDKMLNNKKFIISNLEIIKEIFNGKEGLGFDDYLDFLNVKFTNRNLSVVINEQIEKSKNATEIIDNEDKARAAQDELKKLLILIKTDMFSAMGIAVSFTDADGD